MEQGSGQIDGLRLVKMPAKSPQDNEGQRDVGKQAGLATLHN